MIIIAFHVIFYTNYIFQIIGIPYYRCILFERKLRKPRYIEEIGGNANIYKNQSYTNVNQKISYTQLYNS